MANLQYVALEKIQTHPPVQRIPYILSRVASKNVLDLGALDETAYQLKENSDHWLHQRMSSVAAHVFGVDNSSLIPQQGLRTFKNSVIFKGDVCKLKEIFPRIKATDVIVAGELIEHLPSPLVFLENLKNCQAFSGKELIITTPNACSLHNCLIGIFKRESTHIDHINIFSFKTLNTLCLRAGFETWECIPYHVAFPEIIGKSMGTKKFAALLFEKIINFGERLFPLLSGGWIVKIRI